MLRFKDIEIGMFLWWDFKGPKAQWSYPVMVTAVDIRRGGSIQFVNLDCLMSSGPKNAQGQSTLSQMRLTSQEEVDAYIQNRILELKNAKAEALGILADKTAELIAYEIGIKAIWKRLS